MAWSRERQNPGAAWTREQRNPGRTWTRDTSFPGMTVLPGNYRSRERHSLSREPADEPCIGGAFCPSDARCIGGASGGPAPSVPVPLMNGASVGPRRSSDPADARCIRDASREPAPSVRSRRCTVHRRRAREARAGQSLLAMHGALADHPGSRRRSSGPADARCIPGARASHPAPPMIRASVSPRRRSGLGDARCIGGAFGDLRAVRPALLMNRASVTRPGSRRRSSSPADVRCIGGSAVPPMNRASAAHLGSPAPVGDVRCIAGPAWVVRPRRCTVHRWSAPAIRGPADAPCIAGASGGPAPAIRSRR
jgi:hypothetical protein